jgi:hypothetical protein
MEIKLKVGLILLVIGFILIGVYVALNTDCYIKCKVLGYDVGICKTTPLREANMPKCEISETNIGGTLTCNTRGLGGIAKNCCCK